jgi:hypothetical protein
MDLPDRPRCQRLARVRTTTCVALVRTRRPMLDIGPAVTVVPAPPQLGVERVEHVPVERPDPHLPDQRPDVLVRVPLVRRDRVQLQVDDLEVLVEHLIDRRVRPWVAPLVHLVQQPSPRRLRLRRGLRPGRDHLDEVMPTSRDRVRSRVDADSQCAAWERIDAAATASPDGASPCHDQQRTTRSCHDSCHEIGRGEPGRNKVARQTWWAPGGSNLEPAD